MACSEVWRAKVHCKGYPQRGSESSDFTAAANVPSSNMPLGGRDFWGSFLAVALLELDFGDISIKCCFVEHGTWLKALLRAQWSLKSGGWGLGVPCNEVPAKKFTAARMCRFLSTKWRAVKSGEQKFTAKTPLRGGLRVQTSLQLQMFLRQTCLLGVGTFEGRFCYLKGVLFLYLHW